MRNCPENSARHVIPSGVCGARNLDLRRGRFLVAKSAPRNDVAAGGVFIGRGGAGGMRSCPETAEQAREPVELDLSGMT
jgi:nucleoside phosphorylase